MKYEQLVPGDKQRFTTHKATGSEVVIKMSGDDDGRNYIIQTNWHDKDGIRDLILELIELYKSIP